jgi:hypothetical protein
MIALARNRQTPLQRQTAQHVTNRRAELFFCSDGEEIACLRERDFDRFGQTMAVFEEIHLRRSGAVPYVIAFFRRPASVRTWG